MEKNKVAAAVWFKKAKHDLDEIANDFIKFAKEQNFDFWRK